MDTKVTSDLKVATKPCGCLIIKHRGTEIQRKNFVDFVKKQLCCSLFLPSAGKEIFVSLCLCVQKIKKLCYSVTLCFI